MVGFDVLQQEVAIDDIESSVHTDQSCIVMELLLATRH